METVSMELEQILLVEITMLNGDNTEEDLNMAIAKEIMRDKLQQSESFIIERLDSEVDTADIKANGVYVYVGGLIEELFFERFDTVADAIKTAVNKIDAKIICDGNIITYDILSDTEAYYIDEEVGKVKLVELCA
jgi:hypothetical protein